MSLVISGRHFAKTHALKAYTEEKAAKFNRHHKDIQKSILQLTEKYSKKKQEKQEATKIKETKQKEREEIAKKKAEEEKKKEDELASKVLTEEDRKPTEVTQKEEDIAEQEKILTQKNNQIILKDHGVTNGPKNTETIGIRNPEMLSAKSEI